MSRTLHGGPRSVAGGTALKLVAWVAAIALVALPMIGVSRGWFASQQWPFRQLRIDAAFEQVSADQVRRAIAPALAPGFFAVDLNAVRESVQALPWVASAEVRKRWPDQIEVRIVEYRAQAMFGDGRLISTDGRLFQPSGGAPEGLPLLSGPESRLAELLADDRAIVSRLAGSALQRAQLRMSERGGLSVELSNAARLELGRDAPLERLERFLAVWSRVTPPIAGSELASADLRYANGFALAWRAPPPVSPPNEPAPAAAVPSTASPAAPATGESTPPAVPSPPTAPEPPAADAAEPNSQELRA